MPTVITPNEGIELLYTRDCQAWREALTNLKQALKKEKINNEPRLIIIETEDQAEAYNFYASPTIHINGIDVDPIARRVTRRGLGTNRPYFYQGKSWPAPPTDLLSKALQELYYSQKA